MLEKLIEGSGYKQKFISEKTGISDYRLGRIKAAPQLMTAEEMVSLASFFNMSADEFAEKIGIVAGLREANV
jgi:hypothetical protein